MPQLTTRLAAHIRRGPDTLDTPLAICSTVTFAGLAAWDFILGPGGHLAFTEATVAVWAVSFIIEKRKRRQAEAHLATYRQEHPPTPTP